MKRKIGTAPKPNEILDGENDLVPDPEVAVLIAELDELEIPPAFVVVPDFEVVAAVAVPEVIVAVVFNHISTSKYGDMFEHTCALDPPLVADKTGVVGFSPDEES